MEYRATLSVVCAICFYCHFPHLLQTRGVGDLSWLVHHPRCRSLSLYAVFSLSFLSCTLCDIAVYLSWIRCINVLSHVCHFPAADVVLQFVTCRVISCRVGSRRIQYVMANRECSRG